MALTEEERFTRVKHAWDTYERIGPSGFGELFGVPEQYLPIVAVPVGHADPAADQGGSSGVVKRRGLYDLVHRGHW